MPEDRETRAANISGPGPDALARAEAAATEAAERARAARARAAELRRGVPDSANPGISLPGDNPGAAADAVHGSGTRTRLLRLAAGLAALLAVGTMLAASGYMIRQHRTEVADQSRAAEYTAAARQGVVNLMAINYETADADVQRVLDSSTGAFRTQFEASTKDLVAALKESKIVTEVTVNDTAVESMTPDGAVVLVAATSQRGKTDAANRDPRTWRAVVTIARENGQLKVSQLEFV